MQKPPAEPLYKPLDFAMVRTPLLPVEKYLGLRSIEDQIALLADPRVRRAVAVGSVSLLSALDRFEQSSLSRRDSARLIAKLLRYQIRMSTRPTPYGLFAGCGIASFGSTTSLKIRTAFDHSHTRPDMAWLMEFVAAAEADAAIRRRLRPIRNPLIRFEGDRISLAERMAPHGTGGAQPVSARATSVVERALELAGSCRDYGELAARLEESSPNATPEKVERLLGELREQTFLLTDLRPPLTTASPARCVLDKLASIPEASALREKLEALLAACAEWDKVPHVDSVSAFRSLLKQMDCPEDGSKDVPVQVDLALSAEGQIASNVAQDAARAAELLLRFSPSPRGLSSIAAYRNAFIARYGHEREVPLVELLDPDRGLGPASAHGHAFTGPNPAVSAARAQTLLALACAALRRGRRAVSLTEREIARLETWRPRAESAPVSLDINVMVAAQSAEAIDAGDYMLVVGPNLGAWAAGKNFGRFAHLHAAESGRGPLCRAASAEQAAHYSDHIWAELVFMPRNARSANVTIRPAIRSHEIVFGVSPGVVSENVIPIDELVVGIADGNFYVFWPAAGKRVRFVSGHMLNYQGAPPAAQFLLETAYRDAVSFSSFDWGPAESFPFLPRVQVGRIALRPAEWKLAKDTLANNDGDAFNKWRQEWDVPRYVCLAYGDNRLVLDLDLPDHVEQILSELAKMPEGHGLPLQEVLPALDEAWLAGVEGRYYSEFIVPLVLRPVERASAKEASSHESAPATEIAAPAVEKTTTAAATYRRLRPPGSEWLYLKLYCSRKREDDLISSLPAFAANAIAAELADSWFYIRYGDPDPHIRFRFHGLPERLSNQLFGQACQWANGLLENGTCNRVAFDTYDREIERFGGEEGMAVSEKLFHADSVACAELVGILRSKQWKDPDDRTVLFALTTDDLLAAAGLDGTDRTAWYKRQLPDARDSGTEYRRLKGGLRAALGDPAKWLTGRSFGEAILDALRQRRQSLSLVATALQQLNDERTIGQPLPVLCASYAHLHLNRLGAADDERMLLGLLSRARDSLVKAPL
jgi:lantibiotic biosynthesis protein